MKFGKKYTTFMETEAQKLLPECSYVEFKRLKKLLKKCPHRDTSNVAASAEQMLSSSQGDFTSDGDAYSQTDENGNVEMKTTCAACDTEFFPDLLKAVSSVMDCFTNSSQQLRSLHLASGPRRLFLRLKTKIFSNTPNMIQLGNILVSYGCMNALAVRKILKKYDKVHSSVSGRAFQTKLQSMRAELLQSPWLIELGALAINLMEPKVPRSLNQEGRSSKLEYWTCNLDCERHTLSCVLPGTIQLDFNLQCPICLDIVFDPVALGCGHIFCRSCVCAAASVPAFQGVKAARRGAKCPLCRQQRLQQDCVSDPYKKKKAIIWHFQHPNSAGVYTCAVYLQELAVLIRIRCEEYFHDRKLEEREQRLKEAKEHWEREAMVMMGF